MFGLGNTIGGGIFALTGIAAHYAGPSICISFLISGFIAIASGLMYAELSSRLPNTSGSGFNYTYVTFGELPAWIVGWNQSLRYGMSCAGLSNAMVSYFIGLLDRFDVEFPKWLYDLTVFGVDDCSISAIIFLFLLTIVYTLGMQESNIFNMVFTILKLLTLGFIILLGYINFDINNFSPFTLEEHDGI